MPHVDVLPVNRRDVLETAERRWAAIATARPDLAPAVVLQRRLLGSLIDLLAALEGRSLPRLSLPPRYLAAKLARGVPMLSGEPLPLPVALLKPTLMQLC